MLLNPAITSRPTCLARIVFPFAIPNTCAIFLFGISSAVVVIISFIYFLGLLSLISFLFSIVPSCFRQRIRAIPITMGIRAGIIACVFITIAIPRIIPTVPSIVASFNMVLFGCFSL